jgi:hypothetical protein
VAEFQLGHKKVGGRQKGTPNKDKRAIRELLDSLFPDYDPVIQMAGLAQCSDVPIQTRVYCAAKVAEYIHPKKRAVGLQAETNHSLEHVITKAYCERVVRKDKDAINLEQYQFVGVSATAKSTLFGKATIV